MSSHSLLTLPGRFEEIVREIPDRRSDRNKLYPLPQVLFMALSSVLSGFAGWEAFALFAREKKGWFEQFFPLPEGTPCADTFRRVFEMVKPRALNEAFAQWVETLHEQLEGKLIAIDGKAIRGAFEAAKRTNPLYMLHVWCTEEKLLLACKAIAGAPGETAAAEELLEQLSLAGATLSFDANGCTQKLAQKVIGEGADYLMTLKGNRGAICREVRALFACARTRPHRSREYGHGRSETREVRLLPADRLPEAMRARWAGLRTLVQVKRTRRTAGKTTEQVHHYLTSLLPDPDVIASRIRSHWSVENQLHWVLDVSMSEDACRVRDFTAAENLALIRRVCLNVLRRPGSGKLSIPKKQQSAALNDGYRLELLRLMTKNDVISAR